MKIPRSEYPKIAARLQRRGSDTRASIAEEYGVHVRTIERIIKQQGIQSRPEHPKLTEDQLRRARILLEDECPITEIAATIGCTDYTLRKYGLRSRSRGNGFMYAQIAPLVRELGI